MQLKSPDSKKMWGFFLSLPERHHHIGIPSVDMVMTQVPARAQLHKDFGNLGSSVVISLIALIFVLFF